MINKIIYRKIVSNRYYSSFFL